MNGFNSYKSDLGFDIGSGLSGQSTYIKKKDEQNNRILMEEQYKLLQMQKAEILAQQKFRKEYNKSSKIMLYISVATLFITFLSLITSFFK